MVGAVGIEPTTPSMSPRCSPAELCALIVESDMTNEASFLAPTAVFGKWLAWFKSHDVQRKLATDDEGRFNRRNNIDPASKCRAWTAVMTEFLQANGIQR